MAEMAYRPNTVASSLRRVDGKHNSIAVHLPVKSQGHHAMLPQPRPGCSRTWVRAIYLRLGDQVAVLAESDRHQPAGARVQP